MLLKAFQVRPLLLDGHRHERSSPEQVLGQVVLSEAVVWQGLLHTGLLTLTT